MSTNTYLEKIRAVISAIQSELVITSKGRPLVLDAQHERLFLKVDPEDLEKIILKLMEDEKVIELKRVVNTGTPYSPFLRYEFVVLPKFESYAEQINQQFKKIEANTPKSLLPAKKQETTLSTKEKNTLLKLVLGMAVKGYAYDPKQSRNSAIGDISADLESLGIPVDSDTIRKWLKEAAETHSLKDD